MGRSQNEPSARMAKMQAERDAQIEEIKALANDLLND